MSTTTCNYVSYDYDNCEDIARKMTDGRHCSIMTITQTNKLDTHHNAWPECAHWSHSTIKQLFGSQLNDMNISQKYKITARVHLHNKERQRKRWWRWQRSDQHDDNDDADNISRSSEATSCDKIKRNRKKVKILLVKIWVKIREDRGHWREGWERTSTGY